MRKNVHAIYRQIIFLFLLVNPQKIGTDFIYNIFNYYNAPKQVISVATDIYIYYITSLFFSIVAMGIGGGKQQISERNASTLFLENGEKHLGNRNIFFSFFSFY